MSMRFNTCASCSGHILNAPEWGGRGQLPAVLPISGLHRDHPHVHCPLPALDMTALRNGCACIVSCELLVLWAACELLVVLSLSSGLHRNYMFFSSPMYHHLPTFLYIALEVYLKLQLDCS